MKKISLIITSVIASAFLVFLVFLFLKHYGPRKEIMDTMRKFSALMEIENLQIKGWESENPRWQINASNATMKEKDYVVLKNVTSGCIYNDYQEKILNSLTAEKADVRLRRKQVELFGVTGVFISNAFNNSGLIQIKAGVLSYNERDKKISFYNDIVIEQGTKYIKANLCNIENMSERIRFYNGFQFRSEDVSVNGQELIFNMKDDYIEMRGNLNVIQNDIGGMDGENSSSFKLNCNELLYSKKEDKDSMNFSGKIKLVSQGNVIKAKRGSYWGYKQQLLLDGDVSVAFGDPENIITKGNSVITKNSLLKGLRIFVDTKRKNMNIAGPLTFTQPGLEISALTGFYDFKANRLYLTNSVEIKHNEKLLKCKKVIIDIVTGTFEATGQIYTKITI